MGQRGQLDRIALAHNGPILALDWMLPGTFTSNPGYRSAGASSQGGNWYAGVGSGLFDDNSGSNAPPHESEGNGNGWLASGGLDRTVKVTGTPHVRHNMLSTLCRCGTSLYPAAEVTSHANRCIHCTLLSPCVAWLGGQATNASSQSRRTLKAPRAASPTLLMT